MDGVCTSEETNMVEDTNAEQDTVLEEENASNKEDPMKPEETNGICAEGEDPATGTPAQITEELDDLVVKRRKLREELAKITTQQSYGLSKKSKAKGEIPYPAEQLKRFSVRKTEIQEQLSTLKARAKKLRKLTEKKK
jgi:hypothetical protein